MALGEILSGWLVRSADRTFWGPSSVQSLPDGGWGDVEFSLPLRDAESLPLVSNLSRSSCVVPLRRAISPSAIVRLVVSVIINPIQRIARWARTHVLEESSKAVLPSFAHGNSSQAVVTGIVTGAVRRSPFGIEPRLVFPGFRHSMGRGSFNSLFNFEASTTSGSSRCKIGRDNGSNRSAFAGAYVS